MVYLKYESFIEFMLNNALLNTLDAFISLVKISIFLMAIM